MRVVILSDIHDHTRHLSVALAQAGPAEALVCCGDLCSPFVVPKLGDGFAGPIHIVFGNNDGDRFRIAQQASRFSQMHLHGEFADLEVGGKRFALNHYPEIARAIAASDRYDVVCFGHNHTHEVSRDGRTLLVNPGEILGEFGPPTFVVLETDTLTATRVDLEVD